MDKIDEFLKERCWDICELGRQGRCTQPAAGCTVLDELRGRISGRKDEIEALMGRREEAERELQSIGERLDDIWRNR